MIAILYNGPNHSRVKRAKIRVIPEIITAEPENKTTERKNYLKIIDKFFSVKVYLFSGDLFLSIKKKYDKNVILFRENLLNIRKIYSANRNKFIQFNLQQGQELLQSEKPDTFSDFQVTPGEINIYIFYLRSSGLSASILFILTQ